MAVTLTSDPIVTEAAAADVLEYSADSDLVRFLINAASARFLEYTQRTQITLIDSALTQYDDLPPPGAPAIWLRATPVSEITSVKLLHDGSEEETISSDDYRLRASDGELYLPYHTGSHPDWGYEIETIYKGGWSTVPGDVQAGAFELMRITKERLAGRAGVQSVGFEGISHSYELSSLPRSVAETWEPYRILSR